MKLKSFNQTNTRGLRTGKATVSIAAGGAFGFSKTASIALGLEPPKHIELLQDEDNPRDWYIKLSSENKGFPVRAYGEGGQTMINSASVAAEIRKSLGLTTKTVSFLIGKEPVMVEGKKLWPIITASAKSNDKGFISKL